MGITIAFLKYLSLLIYVYMCVYHTCEKTAWTMSSRASI